MAYYENKDKSVLLHEFEQSYNKLQSLISGLSAEQLDFVAPGGEWSIREVISHIADIEIECYARYRHSVAESDTDVKTLSIDVYKWKDNLNYTSQNVELSMLLLKTLRGLALEHLNRIRENDWNSYIFRHPEMGRINLNMVLSMYTQHIDTHIPEILNNIREFDEK